MLKLATILLFFSELSVFAADSNPWDQFLSNTQFPNDLYQTPLTSACATISKYTITLTHYGRVPNQRPDPSNLTINIENGGRSIYTWKGSQFSSFVLYDDTLFYPDYDYMDCGGELICIDLLTGKQVWKVKIKAIDNTIKHSAYTNKINIHIIQISSIHQSAIEIIGQESQGNYIELYNIKTGELLAHKQYK